MALFTPVARKGMLIVLAAASLSLVSVLAWSQQSSDVEPEYKALMPESSFFIPIKDGTSISSVSMDESGRLAVFNKGKLSSSLLWLDLSGKVLKEMDLTG